MILKPGFKPIEEHKTLLNVGATFDVCTGYWIKGIHGEMILMGGLGPMDSIVGPGNMYKSTILHFRMLSAMAKIWPAYQTSCSTYDSESNIHIQRLKQFVLQHEQFGGVDIIEEQNWVISDTSVYLADEWYGILRDFMKDKRKKAKDYQALLPFNNREGKQATEMLPTFSQMDSLSAMHLAAADEIMNKNDIGSSGGSHVFMREGLGKSQMLHEFTSLGAAAKHYLLCTAHIGDRRSMSTGPGTAPPKKQLQHLPTDTAIKGVTPAFLYNQHNLWYVTNCALLWNKDDKTPKYPKKQGEAIAEDKDLNLVTMQHLRGKAGPSGFRLEIVVSQTEGVLSSLTEFHMLKEYEGFGFIGNDRTYQLALLPEENLTRTTVRQKLDSNPRLRRAMNITAELAQMHQFHRGSQGHKLMSAEDLHKRVIEKGYDINWLLDNTRGWWTYNNDKVDKLFLSTLDLINMAHGVYHPYWMEDDKKTVKKEFQRAA